MTSQADQRVIKVGNEWWVVLATSDRGSGWGTMGSVGEDLVFFTPLSDVAANSRRLRVPRGKLGRYSHRHLVELLDRSEDAGERVPVGAVSVPQVDADSNLPRYHDERGLHWVFKLTSVPQIVADGSSSRIPALAVSCVEDSAVSATVPIAGESEAVLRGERDEDFQRFARAVVRVVGEAFIDD